MNANVDLTGVVLETDRLIIREWNEMVMSIFPVSYTHLLCNGGLACAEVTFRTAAAGEAIHLMKEAHPEMLVGAGTVLTVEPVSYTHLTVFQLNL